MTDENIKKWEQNENFPKIIEPNKNREIQILKEKLDISRKENDSCNIEISQLKTKVELLEDTISNYKGCLNELKKENKELKENLDNEIANIKTLGIELKDCETANKKLRKQISEDTRSIEKEHNDMCSRPTVLAAKLAELGFKGTLVREQPFYNTTVTDGVVGTYTETLKFG